MMRNLTSKLVYRPKGTSELYDLQNDPRELTNLFSSLGYATIVMPHLPQVLSPS